jgi:hypothetical protein
MIPKSIQGSSGFPAAIPTSETEIVETRKNEFGDTPGLSGGDMVKAETEVANIKDGTSNTMMIKRSKTAEGELNATARAADLNSQLDAAQGKKPAAEGTQFMDYTDDSCMND